MPGWPTIEEVKGGSDRVTNIAASKFPTGPAGKYGEVEDTNSR